MSDCQSCGSRPVSPSKRVIRESRYPMPVVKDNGCLLFKKVAPALPGYVHDPNNPKLLKPDKVPCAERITLPVLQRTGQYVIMNQCNHIDCKEWRGKEVTDDICSTCPFRNMPSKTSPIAIRAKGGLPTKGFVGAPSDDNTQPSQ